MDGASIPIAPRSPATVMRLARMGASHATRLCFMRILLRRAEAEGWTFDRPCWEVDTQGVGHAIYRIRTPYRTYSLVAFAHDLPDHLRSDRVIAEAWDATFALVDGEASEADVERLRANVPKQEAGRVSEHELTLSRANRSVRLFSMVVDCLADGRQPDAADLEAVGYLMRTTAVYGSAKFGLADRDAIADRAELSAPFQAEMMTVWLIRMFTIDIVEHLAKCRNPDAVGLDPLLRRRLGVGNSTGLGMAPFLVNHPSLIHHWFAAREEALARVRARDVEPYAQAHFARSLTSARALVESWSTDHPLQAARIETLREDVTRLADHMDGAAPVVWDDLWQWGVEALSIEGQELLAALLIEPHADVVDGLAGEMSAQEGDVFRINGRQTVGAFLEIVRSIYDWALRIDWEAEDQRARVWYTSMEKMEPRLGERATEPLDAYEQPLGPARDVASLTAALAGWAPDAPLSEFLEAHPEHRHTIRRVQIVARHPYAEIRDNTLAADVMPIDMLRAKLSFFGATKFDPRSDRWVRISMFQGAPFPDEIGQGPMDHWMYGG